MVIKIAVARLRQLFLTLYTFCKIFSIFSNIFKAFFVLFYSAKIFDLKNK